MKADDFFILGKLAIHGHLDQLLSNLQRRIPKLKGQWKTAAKKYLLFLRTKEAQFSVITFGNMKHRFHNFSHLPVVTCPGMGECRNYCVSLKGLRRPIVAFSWLQNTTLIESTFGRKIIAEQFLQLPQGATFRVNNDEDFRTTGILKFWMRLFNKRPDITVFCYTKSLKIHLDFFKKGNVFPDNYVVNVSTGGKYPALEDEAVKILPCVRGKYIGVDNLKGRTRQDYANAIKKATNPRTFPCPGNCWKCTGSGPVCANKDRKFDVAIRLH